MKSPTLTRELSREVDQRAMAEYGMSSLVLMENAGRGCVEVMSNIGINGPLVICCGKGNNGGDGFVMARHLHNASHDVHILLSCDPAHLKGDAAVNHHIAARMGIVITSVEADVSSEELTNFFDGADWVVDALLGTGSRGEPQPPIDVLINAMNAAKAKKLAVDLPSGLDCDTGEPAKHTFRADYTCTFVHPKQGFVAAVAKPWLGDVHVIDIGVPQKLVDEILKKSGN